MNLRQYAKGQDCQIRIPGICNFDSATTVLAHLGGAGLALKHHDFTHGAWACSSCHDAVDGRTQPIKYSHDELELMHRQGVTGTQTILVDSGRVEIKLHFNL